MSASTTERVGENIGGKFLTFALGSEEYGLPILAVREILACPDITPVPRSPSHIRGVINLRGQVITVMELRARFGLPPAEWTEKTCIIVVETQINGRKASFGILVDRVCEVVVIPSGDIEPPPTWGASATNDFLIGLGKIGSSVKILLNTAAVVNGPESVSLASAV